MQRIGAGQRHARQANIQLQLGRHHAQKARGAHVREKADARLGHCHLRALGHDTQPCRLPKAHAAAHGDAVHQRNDGLRKLVQRVVEPVFVDKELQPAVVALHAALLRKLIERPHIAARAEAFLARTAQHQRGDAVVVAALLQQRRQLAHHAVRKCIQGSRTVQGDDGHAVDHAHQHLGFGSGGLGWPRLQLDDTHCSVSDSCAECQRGARFSRKAFTPSR